MIDYYRRLQVPRTASAAQIKDAYLRLAVQEHPDKHGGTPEATARFQELSAAYTCLIDDQRRAQHDADLALALVGTLVEGSIRESCTPAGSPLAYVVETLSELENLQMVKRLWAVYKSRRRKKDVDNS